MDHSLETLMTAKTDEELQDYLIDIKYSNADEVRIAFNELKKRGKYYNELQSEYILNIIKRKQAEESPDTPLLYPKQSLFVFSILMPMIFAYITFAFNLTNRRNRWIIIGFAITYTIFSVVLANMLGMAVILLLFNFIGAVLLQSIFWNKFIGKDTYYHNKLILIPVLIALAILVPFVLSAFPEIRQGFLDGFRAKI